MVLNTQYTEHTLYFYYNEGDYFGGYDYVTFVIWNSVHSELILQTRSPFLFGYDTPTVQLVRNKNSASQHEVLELLWCTPAIQR